MAYDAAITLKFMQVAVGIGTFTPPSATYLELVGGVERVPITFETSGSTVQNSNVVTFPLLTSSWGSVTGVTVYDSLVGGTTIATSDWISPSPISLDAGTIVSFPAGTIQFT